MTYDQTFPKYAGRMIRWLLGLGVAGAAVLFFIWGWRVGGAWILGAFFHAAFFMFLRAKYFQWVKDGREPDFIGQRVAVFAIFRFILEIVLAAVVVALTPLNVLGFLGGLLSLPFLSIFERVVNVIKE